MLREEVNVRGKEKPIQKNRQTKLLQKEAEEIGSNLTCWKLQGELPVAGFQNPGFWNGCETS